jgi:TonB family protein
MNALIVYIVASVVSLGVFYAAYIALLRKEPLFRFNRIYLLSVLLLSYLIPLITFLPDSFSLIPIKTTGTGFINAITLSPVVITATAGKMASLPVLLTYIYLIGMAYFTFRLIIRILSIYNLGKNSDRSDENESFILWSNDNIPPFSFLRTMYLPASLKDTPHVNEVIRHEQVHINSFHSFDIVFTQIMQIVCWVNPFIPLIEKSLREIHEFEADKAVIHAGTDPVTYTKILFAQDKTALAVVLGNNFNYSLIKRRLTMFYKKNTRYARLKAVVVLPLAICIVMIYAIGCKQSANKSTETVLAPEAPVQTAPAVQPDGSVPPPPPPPPPPPTTTTTKSTNADPVYTIVKPRPQFPGGDEARHKYIASTVKYPAEAIEKGLQGTVYVSFVVEKDGSIGDVKVLRGIGKSCDEEAVRTVRNMPKWTPGLYNGKPVRVLFNMPIYFKLS